MMFTLRNQLKLFLAVVVLSAGAAQADVIKKEAKSAPMLVLSKGSGFVPKAYVKSYRCEIYSDRVVVHNNADTISSTVVHPIISSGDFSKLIFSASLGEITEFPAPSDAPTIMYQANIHTIHGTVESILLKSRGSYNADNLASSTVTLINFIDMNCK